LQSPFKFSCGHTLLGGVVVAVWGSCCRGMLKVVARRWACGGPVVVGHDHVLAACRAVDCTHPVTEAHGGDEHCVVEVVVVLREVRCVAVGAGAWEALLVVVVPDSDA